MVKSKNQPEESGSDFQKAEGTLGKIQEENRSAIEDVLGQFSNASWNVIGGASKVVTYNVGRSIAWVKRSIESAVEGLNGEKYGHRSKQ